MDFGDILAQWDNQQKKQAEKQRLSGRNTVSHKKANAPSAEEKAALEMKKQRIRMTEHGKKSKQIGHVFDFEQFGQFRAG